MGRNERTLVRMVDFVERGATAFVLASGKALVAELQRVTPVRTRHAKASYTADVGGPAPGFPERSTAESHDVPTPAAVMARARLVFQLGDDLVIGNVAGHSAILARGRRMGSRGMIGSEQAPDPFIPPAIQETQQVMKGWRFRS